MRVIIEKPFGTDLESARELQKTVSSAFREQQVYRIDHYLGKETVQNVMAFRFANYMFEPVWNRNFIDHIQITAAEDIGIGSRAGYYDQSGALRDLVQNHMMQLLTLVCMEPPSSFEADKVRDEKVKVLEAITPPTPEEVAEMTVRAQYTAGVSGGEDAKGYLEEDDVPDDSQTETYAALRLEVHNWRWAGVPIVLRTGKRLARKVTEIAVQLKPVPHLAFQSKGSVGVQPNQLILTMQPNEGVSLSLGAKIPGSRDAHPPGEHGVPLRHGVHVAVARGLRAPDPRRDARRGDAVHAQRRGRRAVVDHRPDPQGVEGGLAADVDLRGGQRRARRGGGADRRRAPLERACERREGTLGRRLVGGRHDAEQDRGGAARDARHAPPRVARVRARPGAQPRRDRRQRVPRRDPEPPPARRALPPLAARAVLGQRGPRHDRRAGGDPDLAVRRARATSRSGASGSGCDIGPKHLGKLDTIVDPLLVPDLATVVWAPHGHAEGLDALRRLAQIVLLDSQDEPTVNAGLDRSAELSENAYVVDLAWLRSTPWRERIAAAFDPPVERARLGSIASVTVRHRDDSLAAAVLFCGWMSSRLGWKPESLGHVGGSYTGHARAKRQEVKICLESANQNAPGLAGVTIETAAGEAVSLDRSPGGLRSLRRARDGSEQSWTVLGASRGESGILGEGVRQALLRDPTYLPALACARAFVA